MKHKKIISIPVLGLAIFICLPAGFVSSQQQDDKQIRVAQTAAVAPIIVPAPNPAGGVTDKISLDLRNIDVVDALKYLSMKANMNIIATKAVTGRVTLMVDNAPISDVFDLMLRSNSLAYDKRGEIFSVMTQEEYRALYGKNFSDIRKVKVFNLQYTVPEQAFSLLDMLKSEVGRVMVDSESGNVMVMDSPERLALMDEVLKDFESKNTVRVFKLNYSKAKDVEDALKNQLDTKKVGLIKSDERGNQIIVQTLPERMDQIAKLINQLDQKTKEVIIDVDIVQIQLSDETDEGFSWQGLSDISSGKALTYLGSTAFSAQSSSSGNSTTTLTRKQTWDSLGNVGSYTLSNSDTGSKLLTNNLHVGVVGNSDLDFVINYLQTIGNTKIMSNPKLAVVNNQEAKIHVGQREAYVTTTTTTGSTTSSVSEQVTFVDVGIMLSVVPVINDEDFINLKVKAEISSVTSTLITPTNNSIPIIDTSLAETTVLVKEGSTVVIGGLRKEQQVESTSQTPYLGKIPILGNLFKNSSKSMKRTELLIIMTPRIITGDSLVSSAHSKTSEGGLKPLKGYEALDINNKRVEDIPSEVFVPLEENESDKLGLKGMRKR